ncbi:MAG: phosphatidate cytidylyltransferase, partial [Phycisphaerales bacterium]|nr:phosphatidate cytidylyltransferase [Phycisphaerales bacterium]
GQRIEGSWTSAAGLLGIAVWTGLLPAFWVLAARDHSAWLVAGLLLVVKMGDIGAYFSGLALGRHKLIPWLSPGKTVEGLIGGLILGGLAGMALSMLSASAQPANQLCMVAGVVGGVLLAFLGALGDLAESLLKRAAGSKDSGRLLPGMGGILDVVDSPLVTGPVAYFLVFLGTGG